MEVSRHGEERLRKRCGFKRSSIDKVVQTAFDKGLKHNELVGSVRRYVDGLYLQYQTGNNIRIYDAKVYIIHNEKLITVFPLPRKYVDVCNKLRKARDASK